MKYLYFYIMIGLIVIPMSLMGQVIDDFFDGDFTTNPVWLGDVGEFEVELEQLNTNGPASTSELHLSTTNSYIDNTTWEFLIDLNFAPSGSNRVRAYLVSDQSDLEGDLNGYYIEIGQSGNDEIKFYRQDGADASLLFTGSSQLSGNVIVRLQVTRGVDGNWAIKSDTAGGSTFISEGAGFLDNTYNSTSYFGFVANHTSSRNDAFYFDDISITSIPVGLSVNEIVVESSDSLRLSFSGAVDEVSAELLTNYSVNNGIIVLEAIRDAFSLNEVVLIISELSNSDYAITVFNVEDQNTNTPLESPEVIDFNYEQLELIGLTTNSETEVKLFFNANVDLSSAQNVTNYSVNSEIGEPTSVEVSVLDGSEVTLTFVSPLQPLTNYTLTYGGIENQLKNSTIMASSFENFTFTVPLTLDEITVLNKNELLLTFNLAIHTITAESTDNYFIDNSIGSPSEAVLDSKDNRIVHLVLADDLSAEHYTITVNHVQDIFNNVIAPNFTFEFDYLPLLVNSIDIISNTEIRIYFNQRIDSVSAENGQNYSLSEEIGLATAAIRNTNDSTVNVSFDNAMVNNTYTLTINNVFNELNNSVAMDIEILVEALFPTNYREIVINEIFFDPTPAQGLPEAEFIELYSRSAKTINLDGFDVTGGTVNPISIEPNGYVILSSTSNSALFETHGNSIGVTSWNGLNNSGEAIVLRDNFGNLLDSVSYTNDWYQDESKEEGGYSVEKINPDMICDYFGNWKASENVNGGTPGSENSVFNNEPDITPPNLVEFKAIDENTFQLVFDEPMDEVSLLEGTYEFDNGITSVLVYLGEPKLLSVLIDTDTDLESGKTYTVNASSVKDCAGNMINETTLSYLFDNISPVLTQINVFSTTSLELVFDEILKKSTGEAEGNFTVNNGIGNPTSARLDDENLNEVVITFDMPFSLDLENELTISNLSDLYENTLSASIIAPFIYSEGIDSVIVVSASHIQILFIESLDEATATNTENYELEGANSFPISAFLNSENDKKVNLIFQTELAENKTLTLKVKNIRSRSGELITTPSVEFEYDTAPPKILELNVLSSNSLEVIFTEQVERVGAESAENYEYDDIYPVSAQLQADGITVILVFEDDFEKETVFQLFIDEVADLYGNNIKTRRKETFVFDVFEPYLDSVYVKSPGELVLIFNEPIGKSLAQVSTNYIVDGVGSPDSAMLEKEYQKKVVLSYDQSLPTKSDQHLTISSLTDTIGNVLKEPLVVSFDNEKLYIGHLLAISDKELQIEFNKPIDATESENLSNYLINEEIRPVQATFSGRVGTLVFDKAFQNKGNYTLSVPKVGTQNLAITKYEFTFDPRLERITIVSGETIEISFETNIDESNSLNPQDFFVEPSIGHPVVALVRSEVQNIIRLILEEVLQSNVSYTVSWENLINEYGNPLPNYSYSLLKDEIPPTILGIQVLNDNSINVKFSELLEQNSAEFKTNYQVDNNIGNATSVAYDSQDSSVLVTFEETFLNGETYVLTVHNLKDEIGNAAKEQVVEFLYNAPYSPKFADLIITEIMASPLEEQTEFLEIYNTSTELIELSGLKITDGTSEAVLFGGIVEPGNYIVLAADEDLFEGINLGSISKWLTLNNGGEAISIYNGDNQIFSMTYTDEWYKSVEKEAGGYSLEMIDVSNPCGEIRNWIASAQLAGSPGKINSVSSDNPDNFPPEILSGVTLSSKSILLEFNEKLYPVSNIRDLITIDPTIIIDQTKLISPENNAIQVDLIKNLEVKQVYNISVGGIKDCVNNVISIEQNSVSVVLPEIADSLDIIINEVLFNPRSGGVDFVELYNNSNKSIDLSGWYIADAVDNLKTITNSHYILHPTEYLVLTQDSDILNTHYPNGNESRFLEMSSFPSFNDDSDFVLIYNAEKRGVDFFEYSDDFHFSLLDDVEGVSLERIAFDVPSNSKDSWQSAAGSVGYATPGLMNSQFVDNSNQQGILTIHPEVFFPDNTGQDDFVTISYQLENAGNFANVLIYNGQGAEVKSLAENQLLSTSGFLTWDGTSDTGGLSGVGYYIVYFEIFDANGNKKVLKETVVLGTRF